MTVLNNCKVVQQAQVSTGASVLLPWVFLVNYISVSKLHWRLLGLPLPGNLQQTTVTGYHIYLYFRDILSGCVRYGSLLSSEQLFTIWIYFQLHFILWTVNSLYIFQTPHCQAFNDYFSFVFVYPCFNSYIAKTKFWLLDSFLCVAIILLWFLWYSSFNLQVS